MRCFEKKPPRQSFMICYVKTCQLLRHIYLGGKKSLVHFKIYTNSRFVFLIGTFIAWLSIMTMRL
jgi:hypothetical protein